MPFRVCMLGIVMLSLAACQSAMIPMPNLYNQPINSKLSQDESREAIKSGAISAGWLVDNVSAGQMIATYRIRAFLTAAVRYPPARLHVVIAA